MYKTFPFVIKRRSGKKHCLFTCDKRMRTEKQGDQRIMYNLEVRKRSWLCHLRQHRVSRYTYLVLDIVYS